MRNRCGNFMHGLGTIRVQVRHLSSLPQSAGIGLGTNLGHYAQVARISSTTLSTAIFEFLCLLLDYFSALSTIPIRARANYIN